MSDVNNDEDLHTAQPSSAKQFKSKSRPHIITQDYPEKNYIRKPIRPGESSYSEAVKDGKLAYIFSTSITKGIRNREFDNYYNLGTARFRRFNGAKAKYVKHYVLPTLYEEKPQIVVLQCGGNDLPKSNANPTPVMDIAKIIIETANLCESHGAEQILISGIITRHKGNYYMERRRTELNEILRNICYDRGYIFIDNENITHDHLSQDGVHLNHEGSDILANNILHSLNNLY